MNPSSGYISQCDGKVNDFEIDWDHVMNVLAQNHQSHAHSNHRELNAHTSSDAVSIGYFAGQDLWRSNVGFNASSIVPVFHGFSNLVSSSFSIPYGSHEATALSDDGAQNSWMSSGLASALSLDAIPLGEPSASLQPWLLPALDATDEGLGVSPILAELFQPLPEHRSDPLCHDSTLRHQDPRFESDLYAATWVRGEGVDRAGWCGYCSSWLKLKDSAYWACTFFTEDES